MTHILSAFLKELEVRLVKYSWVSEVALLLECVRKMMMNGYLEVWRNFLGRHAHFISFSKPDFLLRNVAFKRLHTSFWLLDYLCLSLQCHHVWEKKTSCHLWYGSGFNKLRFSALIITKMKNLAELFLISSSKQVFFSTQKSSKKIESFFNAMHLQFSLSSLVHLHFKSLKVKRNAKISGI